MSSLRTRSLLVLVCFSIALVLVKGQKDKAKEDEEFQCPVEIGTGNFADPKTCRRFYQIYGGILRAFFELLPDNSTIDSEVYCYQLDKLSDFIKHKRPELINTKGVVFRHDNAKPHTSFVTQQKLQLGWDGPPHPPYSHPRIITCSSLYKNVYTCVDGYPYLNRCPSGLYFDDISKFCTFKNEARCGPIVTTPAPQTEPPLDLAEKCKPEECKLPYCFCSKDGTAIPGGLDPEETPQIVLLTFDGALNLNNYEHYKKVFSKKRKNPNGCEIRGTFFLAHEYGNYHMVQELASQGHEMATETISLQNGLEDKGYEEWVGEMIGMREILRHFANISKSEVVGMRAPFLKPGRNTQYKVIEDFGYIYDSSIGVPALPVPVWPYTLDYRIPHECKSGTCPTKSFPGIWEIPLNSHYVEDFEGGHCPYLDQCVLHNFDADDVLQWLQEDFSRHYDQNRAPYMMAFHTNWFSISELEKGLQKFLNWATNQPDVWFITATQALTWMTEPKRIKELNNYDPWNCKKKENLPPRPCSNPNKCGLAFKPAGANVTDVRYMETCRECPNKYPWIGDSEGTGIAGRDNYIPDNLK